MTDTEPQPDADGLDEDALRRRLINRIALAGVAIVALLGGLAIIDSMYVSPAPSRPKIAATPVMADAVKAPEPAPVAEEASQKIAAAPPAAEPSAPEPPKPEAIPSIKSTAAPEESAPPSTPLPRQQRPLTKMPEVRQAGVKPAPAAAPAQDLARQAPATTPTSAPAHAPASRPLTQSVQAERRFVLQMGVFNNLDNAQELLAKLQKAGVAAQIEARVQVGPFKTKAEADEARAKLKAMGLDAGLLMAIHR